MKLPSIGRQLVESQGVRPNETISRPSKMLQIPPPASCAETGGGPLRSQRGRPVYSLNDRMVSSKPKSNDSFWTAFQKFAGPFGAAGRGTRTMYVIEGLLSAESDAGEI
jgi:hypothetical protein